MNNSRWLAMEHVTAQEPPRRKPSPPRTRGTVWDQRFSWNKTLPYNFVGNDFQTWKAYSVSKTGAGAVCSSCHRMGMSKTGAGFQSSLGTAQDFGPAATAIGQVSKNPHSATSPIWMLPGQNTYSAATDADAKAVRNCAKKLVAGEPEPGCSVERIGQGMTCRTAPVRGTVNGSTQGPVVSSRVEDTAPISAACEDDNCASMCGWTAMHGPFWQGPGGDLSPTSSNFYGTALYLWINKGQIGRTFIGAPRPGETTGTPGGDYECINMRTLAQPPTDKCGVFHFNVEDRDGSHYDQQTLIGMPTLDVMTGFIGNVAQASVHDIGDHLSFAMNGANNSLVQSHTEPPYPLKIGPLRGEAMSYTCAGWSPTYLVKDRYSAGDVELVPAGVARDARCWITGISGAWSSTRDDGRVQPFAQIYKQAGALRLRVEPSLANPDHVGAWASCVLTTGTP